MKLLQDIFCESILSTDVHHTMSTEIGIQQIMQEMEGMVSDGYKWDPKKKILDIRADNSFSDLSWVPQIDPTAFGIKMIRFLNCEFESVGIHGTLNCQSPLIVVADGVHLILDPLGIDGGSGTFKNVFFVSDSIYLDNTLLTQDSSLRIDCGHLTLAELTSHILKNLDGNCKTLYIEHMGDQEVRKNFGLPDLATNYIDRLILQHIDSERRFDSKVVPESPTHSKIYQATHKFMKSCKFLSNVKGARVILEDIGGSSDRKYYKLFVALNKHKSLHIEKDTPNRILKIHL